MIFGLIFGLILSQTHFIPAIPLILGSGLIAGYIASRKCKNGIINGFVCTFGIEFVIIILTIIIYLIKTMTNNSLHTSLYPILGHIFLSLIYLTTFGLIYGLIGGIGGHIRFEIRRFKDNKTGRNSENNGYLVCEKCGGYYKLQSGESPEFFEKCQCGGKLDYYKNIDENNFKDIDNNLSYNEEINNLLKEDSEESEEKSDVPTMFGFFNRIVFRTFLGYLIVMALFMFVGFIFAYLQMQNII